MRSQRLFPLIFLAGITSVSIAQDTEPDNNNCGIGADMIILGESTIGAELSPFNDVDFFLVQTPSSGVLTATIGAVVNAAFTLQVWPADCGPGLDAATGMISNPVSTNTLTCGGSYYIRVARQSGTAPLAYVLTTTFAGAEFCECNNSRLTACPVNCGDTISTRLWGRNNGFEAMGWEIAPDQDFYVVDPGGAGVVTINVDQVPANQRIVVTAYDAFGTLIGESALQANGVPVSLSVLSCGGPVTFRIKDHWSSGIFGDAYDLSEDPYTFSVDCLLDEPCECNNERLSACEVACGDTVSARLWGGNSDHEGLGWEIGPDQDFYVVDPGVAGAVAFHVYQVPADLRIVLTAYDSAGTLLGQSALQGNGVPVSLSVLNCGGPVTFRIKDHWSTGIGGDAYDLSEDPYIFWVDCLPEACECNNTPITACPISADTTLQARLYGIHSQFDPDKDIDLYTFDVECDTLKVSVTELSTTQRIRLTLYEDDGITPNGPSVVSPSPGIAPPTLERVGLSPGTYFLKVSENTNVMSPLPYTLSVRDCGSTVSVAERDLARGVILHPNPTTGLLSVNARAGQQLVQVQLRDASGRVMALQPMRGQVDLDLTSFPAGLYLIEVLFQDGSRVRERIVKH